MGKIPGFKAYDIRGKVPSELNEELSYNVGRAFVSKQNAKKVLIGRDVRESSPSLAKALANGMTDAGADVIDLGLCGTEMIYFGTPHLEADGGIMITASHNPPEYNGLKFVKHGSKPMGYDSGLDEIEELILNDNLRTKAAKKGQVISTDIMSDFIKNLQNFYNPENINKFRVVVNAGNGCVGPALDALEPFLPIKMIKVHHEPDSSFPNGVPNPLLPENRNSTTDAMKKHGADLGVAWDGDYDRCFFFDEKGNFIEGYYIVGLLAKSLLKKYPGEKIVHDPRLIWNTFKEVNEAGGEAVESVSGHAFIKQKMREVNSIYGGEMSAHHYFRDNYYSDSGLIPFVLILELLTQENKSMSELVGEMISNFPCSGEINSRVADPEAKLVQLKEQYSDGELDEVDGVSVAYDNWRFNVRMSNTEPLLRLNVESKKDKSLMEEKTRELLEFIRK
jgi:phosphomannomutase